MEVSFIGGGNRSTLRKTPPCGKSLTNLITYIESMQLVLNYLAFQQFDFEHIDRSWWRLFQKMFSLVQQYYIFVNEKCNFVYGWLVYGA